MNFTPPTFSHLPWDRGGVKLGALFNAQHTESAEDVIKSYKFSAISCQYLYISLYFAICLNINIIFVNIEEKNSSHNT